MTGTTGSTSQAAQVKPLYPKRKRKLHNPWTSQNKKPKRKK